MTWSITYDQTFATTPTGVEKLAGWRWYMETFLPSKGWVVSKGETGGIGSVGSSEEWYGVQENFSSFAGDGISYTEGFIVELEGSSSDIVVWNWDGTPGGGTSSQLYSNSNYTHYIPTSTVVEQRWIVLESDENPEYWAVFVSGYLLAFNVEKNTFVPGVFRDGTVLTNVIANQGTPYITKTTSSLNLTMGGMIPGGVTAFTAGQAHYFSTQFGLGQGSYFYGYMNQPDIALRLTGSTSSTAYLRSSNYECRTFEVDGEYWLDFRPGDNGSLAIKTGTNNYNNLVVYSGMP